MCGFFFLFSFVLLLLSCFDFCWYYCCAVVCYFVLVVWGAAGVKVDCEKGHILGSRQSMRGFILTDSRLYSENR